MGRRTRSSSRLNPVTRNARIDWFKRENARALAAPFSNPVFDSILSSLKDKERERQRETKRRDNNNNKSNDNDNFMSTSSSNTNSAYLTRAVHHLKTHLSRLCAFSHSQRCGKTSEEKKLANLFFFFWRNPKLRKKEKESETNALDSLCYTYTRESVRERLRERLRERDGNVRWQLCDETTRARFRDHSFFEI